MKATFVVTEEDLVVSFPSSDKMFNISLTQVPGEVIAVITKELGVSRKPSICSSGQVEIPKASFLYSWVNHVSQNYAQLGSW